MPVGGPSFSDGSWQTAKPSGAPVKESPIPGLPDELVLTQKFQMSRDAYDAAGPVPYNTAHYIYPDFLLVDVGPRRDIYGGNVEFDAKYAKLPPTHYEYPQFPFNTIGMTTAYPPGANNPVLITRNRRVYPVTSRVQYDYFLVPNVLRGNPIANFDPILGNTVNLQSPGDIPSILDMQYVAQNTLNGALLGGLVTTVDSLNLAASDIPTWPTSEQYQAMIADALTNGWNATVTVVVLFATSTLAGVPPNSGHMAGTVDTVHSTQGGLIPVERSRIDRWMGNIWQRATRYVLAE